MKEDTWVQEREMKFSGRVLVATLLAFVSAIISRSLCSAVPGYDSFYDALPETIQWLEQPFRWTAVCMLALFLASRVTPLHAIRELGLNRSAVQGVSFAFLATSPMLVVPLLLGQFDAESIVFRLLFSAAVWPMAEEILFRGYAFGQLHRRAGLGLWPAAGLTGVVFGVGHLGQASVQQLPLAGEIGTVLIIGIGGLLFAWLYANWGFNLWIPFFLHCFMNLSWSVFDLADSPLGGWLPNILRVAAVLLAITLTIYRERIPFLRDGAVKM
jgi:membrane protease YdiL (CAAX protease family)